MESSFFDILSQNLTTALPEHVKDLSSDMRKNFKAILEAGFSKLNLVTQEEFNIQRKVLLKTQAQLKILTERVNELEQKI